MKKWIIVIIALLYSFLGVNMLFAAADTWTQKADFGGTARDSRRLLHREQGLHWDGIRWLQKTSGSTTLPPIPGHRRPISGGQRDMVPSASPSGARAT